MGIYLEDHYYDRTDAAVVFKRVDRETGDVRYIYHGNDGTSMPWNDTAQLDFLKPEVREAVIQTIIRVAKRFPIIRFDAAMVLTKMHFQRLWYPEPGTGGAIPSRAEHGMTKEEFDRHMPREFWREVVDRVAQEAPDTLLLAREHVSGLEVIHNTRDLHERGWYVELGAYKTQVFLDFRIVYDTDVTWRAVYERLAGRGVSDIAAEHARVREDMVAAALEDLIRFLDTVPFEEIPTALTPARVPPLVRNAAFLAALREAFGTLVGQLQDLRRASKAEPRALEEALAYLLDTPAFGRWLRARLVKGAWEKTTGATR